MATAYISIIRRGFTACLMRRSAKGRYICALALGGVVSLYSGSSVSHLRAAHCDELVPRYATPAQAYDALYGKIVGKPMVAHADMSTDVMPFVAPLRTIRVTSTFGVRVHPIRLTRHEHTGIDLAAPTGTPVLAAAPGVVRFVGRNASYGKYVVVQHTHGRSSYYGHLSAFAKGLRVGDRVGTGQRLGAVGSTGMATGPHLHFEIRERGQIVDPLLLTAGIGDRATQKIAAAPSSVASAHMVRTHARFSAAGAEDICARG
jgi:murein DD-endopeptidase MepM/ murein hydrolase activator NlpD